MRLSSRWATDSARALAAATAWLGMAPLGLSPAGLSADASREPRRAAYEDPVGPPVRCPEPLTVEPAGAEPGRLFRWRAEPGLEPVARALARSRELLSPLPGIGEVADALGGGPVTVWLLEDLGCLAAHGLGDARPDWVAGVASRGGEFIALRVDRGAGDLRSLPAVFRHEVAHLALDAATGRNAPRWLHEGYAQYAAGSWDWQEAWRLRLVLLGRGGELLRELSLGFPRDAEGARLAYLLSYTALHELASMGGEDGLFAFFLQLREGASADQALRRVFGLTEAQFEERWRRRVAERYGILYVLSRASVFWVAVTLLLLWLGGRRRRRDRERMAELRAQDEREAALGETAPR